MPDLEELIRNSLDRQAPRPDPDGIMQRVAQRKRQVRIVRRVQSMTLAVVVVAGLGAGGYALARAFGVGEHRPSPAASTTLPGPSVTPPIGPCGELAGTLSVVSQEGAAGTISTVWRFTNSTNTACSSFGYPTLDVHGIHVHGPSSWIRLEMLHGGYANIDVPPAHLVVEPGDSLFFVTYWSDATTNAGSCLQFDRVRVTLPGSAASLAIDSAGCIGPTQVHIGPVSVAPPQS